MTSWAAGIAGVPLFGLVVGFSPTLYGISFHYLVKGPAGRRAVGWMTVGLTLSCVLLFGLYQFSDAEVISKYLTTDVRKLVVQRYVDLVAGALLIASAVLLGLRKQSDRSGKAPAEPSLDERQPSKPSKNPDDCSPRTALALGFTNLFIGSSGFATMYLVTRLISSISHEPLMRILVFLLFIPTLVGPYLLVAWGWDRWPQLASAVTSAYEKIVHRDYYKVLVIGLAIAGLFFLVLGIRGMILHR